MSSLLYSVAKMEGDGKEIQLLNLGFPRSIKREEMEKMKEVECIEWKQEVILVHFKQLFVVSNTAISKST